MATKWTRHGRYETAPTDFPGVFRVKAGGYYVRQVLHDEKTGKRREVARLLPDATDERAAYAELERAVKEARPSEDAERPRFGPYALALFKRKVARGDIKSAKGREKWGIALEFHLNYFDDFYLDQMRRADIEAWQDQVAERIRKKKLSPHTANGWLSILKVIVQAAVAEHELPRNPVAGLKPFDTSDWRTYTEEEPNSLRPEHVPLFLEEMRSLYPQHYAMTFLGFTTGLRPSSLRPLRRKGPKADIKWDEGMLLVRRSHTMKQEVMDRTKTARDQVIHLPQELVEVLRAHEKTMDFMQRQSDLLFPSETGGFRTHSVLDKPFQRARESINERHEKDPEKHPLSIPYEVTPRAMRRTFQDLARAAEVKDLVARSISGHATEKMQHRYSTVNPEEQRQAVARVLRFTGCGR